MKKVLVILPDGFEILEAAAFLDVLGWANEYGDTRFAAMTAGVSTELRPSFGALTVQPSCLLEAVEVEAFDAVAIPGGFETEGFYEDAFSEPVLRLLREFADRGKPVASICVGALPVARSRALQGRRATTYHVDGDYRIKQLAEMGVETVRERVVVDGRIITSNGPSTAVEVALELVTMLSSRENADHIGYLMGFLRQ